jgi:hypothetical protein
LAAKAKGTGEAGFLKEIKEDPSKIFDGLKHKHYSYVSASIGMAYNGKMVDSVSSKHVSSLLSLSKKSPYFENISFLLNFSDNKDAYVEAFKKDKRYGWKILAAAAAYGEIIKDHSAGQTTAASSESGKKKKKKKKSKKGNSGTPLNVDLAELLSSKDKVILQYSALSASYGGQQEHLEKLEKLGERDKFHKACSILLKAQAGNCPSEAEMMKIYKSMGKVSKPMSKVDGRLSSYEILVPPHLLLVKAVTKQAKTGYEQFLAQAMKESDIRIRVEAFRALQASGGDAHMDKALATLGKSPFPIQVEAIDYIVSQPKASSIKPLVDALSQETGRLRANLMWAIYALAGEEMGPRFEDIKDWAEEAANQEVDPAAVAEFVSKRHVRSIDFLNENTYFYDIPVLSEKFVYLVDTSASMKGGRIDSLRMSLMDSIYKISQKGTLYNIVDFGGDIVEMVPKKMTTDKKKGPYRVEDFVLTVATRTYDSFERVFALPDFDTILFLSDGSPTGYQIRSWGDMIGAINFLNRYRNAAIHCVEFGAGESGLRAMTEVSSRHQGQLCEVFIEMEGDDPDAAGKKKGGKKGKKKK